MIRILAVIAAVAVARHLYKVAADRKPSTLQRLDPGDTVIVVSMSPRVADELTGDCSIDCLDGCAYPGQFSECDMGSECNSD